MLNENAKTLKASDKKCGSPKSLSDLIMI